MTVEWTHRLAVGVKDIDLQHQELFRRVDQLLEACREGRGRIEVYNLVLFLHDYVIMHFEAEERLMEGAGYPGYRGHKDEHIAFKAGLDEFTRTLDQGKPEVSLVLTINRTMVEWLIHHVSRSDKAFGAFLSHSSEGVPLAAIVPVQVAQRRNLP